MYLVTGKPELGKDKIEKSMRMPLYPLSLVIQNNLSVNLAERVCLVRGGLRLA